ncbi:hypothetical protein NB640_06315 [Oxalobacter vibrioformis]|uniref:Toprim domain-containing protein n=1 Tax=Oxalobacter vibrioformis TaxID=933080 RepID=A0A9E9LYH6_9BURK|nr:hypothetical protein [Oxalobacter vibrioformis]WAW11239.1 hypothetical protein NB640_06315 [Oxalobacter vibrioformis]
MSLQTQADKILRQSRAISIAKAIWDSAGPAKAEHAYLRKKGIQPHGTKEHNGLLIVPVTDRRKIISLQYIHTNGTSRFMPNGRTRGGYYMTGKPGQSDIICIAESFAAGASIYEMTSYPVAVAFYADNLRHVIRTIKELYPFKTLVICPDEDCLPQESTGKAKKTKAPLCSVIHAGQMTMARQIKKLASPEAKRCQAHLLCQSLIQMLRV